MLELLQDKSLGLVHPLVELNWAMKKTGCLEDMGDETLPSYVVIIINRYKDPY